MNLVHCSPRFTPPPAPDGTINKKCLAPQHSSISTGIFSHARRSFTTMLSTSCSFAPVGGDFLLSLSMSNKPRMQFITMLLLMLLRLILFFAPLPTLLVARMSLSSLGSFVSSMSSLLLGLGCSVTTYVSCACDLWDVQPLLRPKLRGLSWWILASFQSLGRGTSILAPPFFCLCHLMSFPFSGRRAIRIFKGQSMSLRWSTR